MEKTTTEKYIEAVGKRKTAVARVRLTPASKKKITVNGKNISDYFKTPELRGITEEAFLKSKAPDNFIVSIKVSGGGISAQAQAARLGIARALLATSSDLRRVLREGRLLTRDSRIKERRKFGLKKARKAPQWSKR